MRYVRIKPHADTPRSPCGRLVYVECGEPCAAGHKPQFILHEGEDLWIPAWAAAELAERGHEILEFSEIRDGVHVVLDGVTAAQIDTERELGVMPDHEVDRFLRHHGYHDHLMTRAAPPARSNLKEMSASLGNPLARHAAPEPKEMRTKALELHRARHARKQAVTKPKGKLR